MVLPYFHGQSFEVLLAYGEDSKGFGYPRDVRGQMNRHTPR
jgi:hypothetical protein